MIMMDFQSWLNAVGAQITVDGACGPATRGAISQVFVNKAAPAMTRDGIDALARDLGCTTKQLDAVATVESSGAGFDSQGRPKILFERHKFDSFTNGQWSVSSYSNPQSGGYSEDSWDKLGQAACKDICAAFKSASWGKFQVMGFWAFDFGFCSALEMAWACRQSEAAHYQLFADYIRVAQLGPALRKVSTNPDDCRAFAKGYNGPKYEQGNYHVKIANEMAR